MTRIASLLSLVFLIPTLSSCMFIGLNEDVKQLRAATSIAGTIEYVSNSTLPIVVTLSRSRDGGMTLQDYAVVYGDNDFFFSAPAGNYYVLAFEDSNRDFALQEGERVGWHGAPSLVGAASGEAITEIAIQLRDPSDAKTELPELYVPGEKHESVNFDNSKLGHVVDVSTFTPEIGPMGMWEPVKYHQQGHSGIYFLENYDSEKIPVLFVHGISGSGHNWLNLVEQLDRERFQPWIVQYPSGMRLNLLSTLLSQSVNELRAIHGFEDMAVVAHSMGGLVSRGFINEQPITDNKQSPIKIFVSISTPWLGHKAASQGAKAPVAVPSWFDMVPGSPFLRSLHKTPLADNTNYHLLFSYQGKGRGIFGSSNTDGTVSLRSQLSLVAQKEAIKVTGFDENHTSILNSKTVHDQVTEILAEKFPE